MDFRKSGTAAAWITFKAENKWGAVFDGQNNTTTYGCVFEPNVSYVQVQDFEFMGMNKMAFGLWNNSNIRITGNKIHDIGRMCTDTELGLVGIYLNSSSDITIERNLIYHLG